jgi:hypothetical protein
MTRARIAQTLPANTLAIELVETDGMFHPTSRLSWSGLLSDFFQWHRPARY